MFVTGGSDGSGAIDDYATVAYDAATGAELWAARYAGPGDGYDTGIAVDVSPDGATSATARAVKSATFSGRRFSGQSLAHSKDDA